jgi:hypothetical protein
MNERISGFPVRNRLKQKQTAGKPDLSVFNTSEGA